MLGSVIVAEGESEGAVAGQSNPHVAPVMEMDNESENS